MSFAIGLVVGFAIGVLCVALTVLLARADANRDESVVWRSNMDQILDAEAEAEAMGGSNG